jgi:CRP-like cAMP-binding protein
MPRSSATNHELQRIGLLAGMPGETLARLGKQMEREEIPPGTVVVREGDSDDRFYVVFSGMLTVTNAMGVRRTATVTAMTPCVVAWCDRAAFDEFIRPLFADDDDSRLL